MRSIKVPFPGHPECHTDDGALPRTGVDIELAVDAFRAHEHVVDAIALLYEFRVKTSTIIL